MKKLLGTTLALAMFVPAGANAELLKNLKISGQLDIQTTSARNVEDFVTRGNHAAGGSGPGAAAANNDRIGSASTRAMLKADWDLLDDVHARVTLVKGAAEINANGQARVYGAGAQTVQGVTDTTLVQEANVKIDKVFGALDVTAGRQFYGEEGDLIVYYGPRDSYGLRVDAIDMFRADWNGEHMSVTAIAGKTAHGDATPTLGTNATDRDSATDLRGIVVSCKMHEMVKPSLYVYNQVVHATGALGASGAAGQATAGGKNTNLWVIGAKAKVAAGGLSASAELAVNRGEDRTLADNTSFKGWAFLGKAAYKADLGDVGAITLGVSSATARAIATARGRATGTSSPSTRTIVPAASTVASIGTLLPFSAASVPRRRPTACPTASSGASASRPPRLRSTS
ncbi:MAG: hypothetical protein M0D55_13690 [Elusimicrobiota bacterium]|nr:MAG: hypothetical protein M0D55_13690 [Elusimicrobiota bacterium]